MLKFFISILLGLLFSTGLLTGCSFNETSAAPKEGLKLVSTQSSIGAVYENNFDQQKLTYQAALINDAKQSIFIAWVEPVLAEELTKRTQNIRINVQKNIEPGKSLEVKGELRFDAKGLSKEEIIKWEPLLKGFKISNEKFLQIK